MNETQLLKELLAEVRRIRRILENIESNLEDVESSLTSIETSMR